MKSRSEIWLRSLQELGDQCSVSTTRDAETLARRVAQEGESFFTLTLPAFGKAFEQCLAKREIPSHAFEGWKRGDMHVNFIVDRQLVVDSSTFKRRGIPKFLGGFLGLVFRDVEAVPCSYAEVSDDYLESVPTLRNFYEGVPFDDQVGAVAAVRQLTLMFAKEKVLCTPAKVDEAFKNYKKTDQELDVPLY